jgi:hypothetical protein
MVDTALKVIRVLLIVSLILTVIGAVSVFVLPIGFGERVQVMPMVEGVGFTDVSIGNLTLALTPQASESIVARDVQIKGAATLLIGSVMVAFGLFIIHTMQSAVKEVRDGTPFSAKAISALRRLGIATIIGSVLIPLMESLATWSTIQATHIMDALTVSDQIASARYTFVGFNGFALLIGVAILLFAKIFEYGAGLQALSDETL